MKKNSQKAKYYFLRVNDTQPLKDAERSISAKSNKSRSFNDKVSFGLYVSLRSSLIR